MISTQHTNHFALGQQLASRREAYGAVARNDELLLEIDLATTSHLVGYKRGRSPQHSGHVERELHFRGPGARFVERESVVVPVRAERALYLETLRQLLDVQQVIQIEGQRDVVRGRRVHARRGNAGPIQSLVARRV